MDNNLIEDLLDIKKDEINYNILDDIENLSLNKEEENIISYKVKIKVKNKEIIVLIDKLMYYCKIKNLEIRPNNKFYRQNIYNIINNSFKLRENTHYYILQYFDNLLNNKFYIYINKHDCYTQLSAIKYIKDLHKYYIKLYCCIVIIILILILVIIYFII